MKLRQTLLLSALLWASVTKAQPLVDCNCLKNLHELHTFACQDVIPDVCALAFQCLLTPAPPQCSQTPPPGGSVGPGTYPITVTFVDFSSGSAVTQQCFVNFVVDVPATGCGCVPPPGGMVGWWPLDETCGATIFADFSGSGNAAIVQSGGPTCTAGSPNAVPGKVAGANYFYGPTVRGRAPNAPSLNFGTNSFSIDCWVNPVPAGGVQPIVDKLDRPTVTTAFGYALSISNGNVQLRVGDGTLNTYTGPAVTFNAWNFVAVAVNRTSNIVRFFVNGVAGSPLPLTPAGSFSSAVDLFIGGSHNLNEPYGELAIDELEIFNRVVTASEINSIWLADQAGKCKQQPPCTNSAVSIFCPPDTNVQTCFSNAVVFFPSAVASTSCGTITNIFSTPPNGSTFPLGTNIVVWTAIDSQGHSNFCTFNVIVTGDRTPPNCPPTSLSVTGCPPLMPNYATNGLITDNCTLSGQLIITQSVSPGSVLPPGQTTVSITACDAAGNCVQCVVIVTAVYSGALPVITCPTNIVAKAYPWCETNGTIVAYPLPQVSNGTLVSCTPPSGSFFPYGLTTVTCIATNNCGTSQCTFSITVMFDLLIPPCTPPPSNMVMWLQFDEPSGATAYNSSAGNNGLLANNPTHNLGQYVVNSLCFNGVNQYVQVAPYAAMQFGTNDFTVDAWVKPATVANTVRVIVDHREENGPVVRGYSLFLGANNTVGFQIADGTFINYAFASVVPANGYWHHIAVTVKRNNSQGIKLYVDGVQDAQTKDPTGHPGSVTAGPCYPFRVASRSSTVSGLFPGCVDEVELFRRALTAAEVQAIYNARCKGKCRITCQAGGFNQIPACWISHTITNPLVINNPLPYSQVFNWTLTPLPAGGACNKPGPTFSPSSGTVTNAPFSPSVILTAITLPPGFTFGDCTCWRMTITTPDGQQAICDGSFCLPRMGNVCVTPSTLLGVATNLDEGTMTFSIEGITNTPTVLSNGVITLRSPEEGMIHVTPLPTMTIPPAGGGIVTIPTSFTFPEYDPGRYYRLVLEADTDGDGQIEELSSATVINALPATVSEGGLVAKIGIGGTIIIIWPDPCGIIEVNPNLANPAGWTTGPVQTSPWTITPAPGSGPQFIRLRK